MNMFDAAGEMLAQTLFQNEIPVTYAHGAEVRTLTAVRAGTSWHDIEMVKTQLNLLSSSRDYIFRTSDFSANAPCVKDKITDGEETWTVYKIDGSECWRKIPNTNLIRIHCKK